MKQNYYFTFGSHPEYPYGREDYVLVIAPDIRTAAQIFRKWHPNRPDSDLLNCADYYDESTFNAFRDVFYEDRGPAEILTERGKICRTGTKNHWSVQTAVQ